MPGRFSRLPQAIRRRWLTWQQNRRIQSLARQVERHAPAPAGQPVIVFNASTRLSSLSLNAGFSLITAWALRLAGVPVIQFACHRGLSRCVLGTDRDHPDRLPPCAQCIRQSKSVTAHGGVQWFTFEADAGLVKALKGLSLPDLEDFVYRGVPLGRLVLPSLRWVLRRHHLKDDAETHFLFSEYIQSAYRVILEFNALIEREKPRAVLVFNGMFFPEASARWAAQQKGIPVVAHEVGLQPFSGFFTTGEATAYPIDLPPDYRLTAEQDQRLDAYLEQRFQGNFSMAGVRFWPEMRSLGPAFWQKAGAFKQIVPVFTNVIFDTSQGHANVVFPHMFAWLDEVLEIIRAHPETYYVIRAHPDESRPGKESRESVADWVAARDVKSLANVLFVDSGEYFSSYELIGRSKFVMVYNSTIGLEATLLGAPVLCAGKARFTQLPTVFFPPSPEAFRAQAEEFLSAEKIEVPPEFRVNARRFLYTQLFRTSLPFGDLLKEDPLWRGYVALKDISYRSLLAQNSPAIRVILDGLLRGGSFLLD